MPHETMHNPASPGELLREFLGDHSATELAEHIGVARATVSRILNGRTAVTMDLEHPAGRGFFPVTRLLLEGAIAAGIYGKLRSGSAGRSSPWLRR